MALNTANKRFAMLGSFMPTVLSVLPVPDGAIDADDRFFLLGLNPLALSTGEAGAATSGNTVGVGIGVGISQGA